MFTLLHLGAEADPKNLETLDRNQEGGLVGSPQDQAYRRANHPCLPGEITIGTGEVFAGNLGDFTDQLTAVYVMGTYPVPPQQTLARDLALPAGSTVPLAPLFDHPDNEGTQWIPGDFDVPPQIIVDVAAATRALITIRVETPFGNYEDEFEMERGQLREFQGEPEEGNDDSKMVCLPEDISLLDKQAAIFLANPDLTPPLRRQHQFRHPSWSLLGQLDAAAKASGGFQWDNPNEDLPEELTFSHNGWRFSGRRVKYLSDGEAFDEEIESTVMDPGGDPVIITATGVRNRRILDVDWSISTDPARIAFYNSGHPDRAKSAWRFPLTACVVAQEVSGITYSLDEIVEAGLSPEEGRIVYSEMADHEAAFHKSNPPTFYFWYAHPHLEARADNLESVYAEVTALKSQVGKTIFKTTRPFPVPPVFTFTATEFVEDFKAFEFA
jgi:hypothetical protein